MSHWDFQATSVFSRHLQGLISYRYHYRITQSVLLLLDSRINRVFYIKDKARKNLLAEDFVPGGLNIVNILQLKCYVSS